VTECYTAAPYTCIAFISLGGCSLATIPQTTIEVQVDMPPKQNLEPRNLETDCRHAWIRARGCSTAAPWMCIASSCPGCRLWSRMQRATAAAQVDMPPRQNLERHHLRTHNRTDWNPVQKCLTAAPGMCSASRCPGCRSSSTIPQATTADQVDMTLRPSLERRHLKTHDRTDCNPA
jgi:hypothetical protein